MSRDLLGKLKAVAVGLKRELRVYRLVLRDKRTPTLARVLLALAVGYAVFPLDLIPDFIPVVGYLDDVLIVGGLVALALKMIPRNVLDDCRSKVAAATKASEQGSAQPADETDAAR